MCFLFYTKYPKRHFCFMAYLLCYGNFRGIRRKKFCKKACRSYLAKNLVGIISQNSLKHICDGDPVLVKFLQVFSRETWEIF